MAKIKYEESKADRDHLRDLLRRCGKDSVDVDTREAIEEFLSSTPTRVELF